MGDNSFTFIPENFNGISTINDLTNDIIKIIKPIRENQNEYREIIEQIKGMESFLNINVNSDISVLLQAYKKLQNFSMKMRKLLSRFITNIELYSNITYALYYNNERYITEEIKIDWLNKRSDGTLLLDLQKATKEIKNTLLDDVDIFIQELLKNHYLKYFNAISGMYKGTIGLGGKINQGHVTEAFESHLALHHSNSYRFINQVGNKNFTIDKIILFQGLKKEFTINYWADKESPDAAWAHIRGALGNQRGTVAGDVGFMQVKRGANRGYGKTARLITLKNLQTGISYYSDIINPQIPIERVAKNIATYLSERINSNEQKIQAYIANKQQLGKNITINKDNYIIHI